MAPIEEKKKQEVKEIPVVEVTPVIPEEPKKRVPRQIIDEMVEGKRRVTIVY